MHLLLRELSCGKKAKGDLPRLPVTAVPPQKKVRACFLAVDETLLPELERFSDSPVLVDFFVEWVFNLRGGACNGTVLRLTPMACSYLKNHHMVTSVDVDGTATVTTLGSSTPGPAAGPLFSQGPDAPWHLDRIDTRPRLLEGTYDYTNTGVGIDLYILDSGINTAHTEFTGRVDTGANFVLEFPPSDVEDCMGHGTHVAGM